MQSVNLYLWYKEENDFHFVIKLSLIVEGKTTNSRYFHGRSISFLEHIFIQVVLLIYCYEKKCFIGKFKMIQL